MKKVKVISCMVLVLVVCMSLTVPAFAADATATPVPAPSFNQVVNPVVDLINSLLKPLLGIVVAIGSLYCVILGVKYAKAEEPQDREKAKSHLKNAIIGFVIIFVLIMALNIMKEPLITWVNQNIGTNVIQ